MRRKRAEALALQGGTFWDAKSAGSLHALRTQTGPPSYTSKTFFFPC